LELNVNKYINPFTDFGFKKLFGEESSKESLIAFLNELLRGEHGTIEDLTYLNPEQLSSGEDHRKTFFDLYCRTENNEHFIVEIQRQRHKNFKERMVYYATFPIRNQAIKGEWMFNLNAVYVVAILDFTLEDNEENRILSRVKLLNTETCREFYSKLTFICLEVPRFNKSENELETLFDKWLFLLSRMERLERIPASVKENIFMKFLERAELAMLSEEERFKYERSLKVYRDDLLAITSAKEEGWEEGLAEGIVKGKTEGKAEGLNLGKKQKSLEIAKKLLARSVPIQEIMEIAGLSFDEISDLSEM
jgi:predicted transposase/invertase (TIGR01784 family)